LSTVTDGRLAGNNGKARPVNKENGMKQLVTRFLNDDSGQDLIEYALVAAVIALGAIAAMGTLQNAISNAFGGVGNSLNSAV
jgi:pilus assembly protein Flp/PilA